MIPALYVHIDTLRSLLDKPDESNSIFVKLNEPNNTKNLHNLTRTDLEILKKLIENPRKRIEQLSKETELSTKTIKQRIRKN